MARGGTRSLYGPFHPKPFLDSMIPLSCLAATALHGSAGQELPGCGGATHHGLQNPAASACPTEEIWHLRAEEATPTSGTVSVLPSWGTVRIFLRCCRNKTSLLCTCPGSGLIPVVTPPSCHHDFHILPVLLPGARGQGDTPNSIPFPSQCLIPVLASLSPVTLWVRGCCLGPSSLIPQGRGSGGVAWGREASSPQDGGREIGDPRRTREIQSVTREINRSAPNKSQRQTWRVGVWLVKPRPSTQPIAAVAASPPPL